MGDLIENGIKTVQIRPHYVLKFREKKTSTSADDETAENQNRRRLHDRPG